MKESNKPVIRNLKSNNYQDGEQAVMCSCLHTFSFRVLINISVRVLCIAHATYLMYFCYVNIQKNMYVFLPAVACVFMLLEGMYVIVRYDGKESKYFSACMFLYLLSVIPPFWIIEMKAKDKVHSELIKILQQLFYIITILLRWWLPKYKCTRDQRTSVIIFLINIASDAQELQSNVSELRTNPIISEISNYYRIQDYIAKIYLFTWTWSLPLLCVSVDESLSHEVHDESLRNYKKPVTHRSRIIDERFRALESNFFHMLLRNFYWKFFYVILLIDLPYLIIRIISKVLLTNGVPPDIFFFIGKNAIQVVVGVYRVVCRVFFRNKMSDEARYDTLIRILSN